MTSVVGEQGINAVKPTAYWAWRPKIKMINHVYKNTGSCICKQFNYVDPTEDSLKLIELMDLCTELIDKVTILENALKQSKESHAQTLTMLMKKVKRLEDKLKSTCKSSKRICLLKKEILEKMINLKIKAEESTMAHELIKFIKSQIAEQS
ncbi:hypothetical protein Tco_1525784 [Tanacetum coccineum]